MARTAANPITYAKETVTAVLKSMDRIKNLSRYDELTKEMRAQITAALHTKVVTIEDALDGTVVESEFEFNG